MSRTTTTYMSIVACLAGLSTISFGGVPIPDAVLYGSVTIECSPISSGASIAIVARVDGVTDPVGIAYFVAGEQTAGSYVLNIQIESGVDGSSRSAGTARVSDMVRIYLKQGTAPESNVGNFQISKMGVVEQLNLELHTGTCLGDADNDGDVDLSDIAIFQRCFTGSNGGVDSGCDVYNANPDGGVDLEDWFSIGVQLIGPQ